MIMTRVAEVQPPSFKEITIWVIRRFNYWAGPIRILTLRIFLIFCIAGLFVDVLEFTISCQISAKDLLFSRFCCLSCPS